MDWNWQRLFAPRPLEQRAAQLLLPGRTEPVWFAAAEAADLRVLGPETFLSAGELARATEFKFGQPRENFTLGRLAGKLAVAGAELASRPFTPAHSTGGGEGEDLSRRLRSIEISNGSRGEPVVRAGDLQSPSVASEFTADGDCKSPARGVSLSHVNGRGVAIAFPRGQQVGVDLELIDARRAETVRKAVPLSSFEEAWLKTTTLPETTALLLLWTGREALGKALGCGLACAWETLALEEIQPSANGTWVGRYAHHAALRCRSWVGSDSVLSLAWGGAKA